MLLGPLVVVTCGAQGAWAATSDVDVSVRAEPIEVVDTVGASDSFMAGLLAMAHHTGLLGSANRPELRRLDRDTVARLLQAATQVAAVTCGRRGAYSPTAAELAAFGS